MAAATAMASIEHVVSPSYLDQHVARFSYVGAANFSQLLLDPANDQLFVGGRDHLFRLRAGDVSLLDSVEWPASDATVRLCRTKGRSADECRNYATTLLLDRSPAAVAAVENATAGVADGSPVGGANASGVVVFCGTHAYAPLCRRYLPLDLGVMLQETDGIGVSPYSPRVNSTSLISEDGDLFVGSLVDFSGNDAVFLRMGSERPLLRTQQYIAEYLNVPSFVASFEVGDYVYVFFRENSVEFQRCGRAIYSRVARVCKRDRGSMFMRNQWTTFLKARLNCSLPGSVPFYFDEMQSVDYVVADRTFYVAFTTAEISIFGSAVCSYTLDDIEETFRGPLTGILDSWSRGKMTPDRFFCREKDPSAPIVFKPVAGELLTDPNELTGDELIDVKRFTQTFSAVPSATQRGERQPLYYSELERVAHLRVTRVRTAHQGVVEVMFICTLEGTIKKVVLHPLSNATCLVEQMQPFAAGEVVNRLLLVGGESASATASAAGAALVAATDRAVVRLPVSLCGRHRTRAACLAAGDPYCGWDRRQRRCSAPPGDNPLDPEWEQGDVCPGGEAAADPTGAADRNSGGGGGGPRPRTVDGGWSRWSAWRECELAGPEERAAHRADTGTAENDAASDASGSASNNGNNPNNNQNDRKCQCRRRRCDSPPPANGGRACEGSELQVTNCTQHGGWTDWSEWSACSAPCGPGFQRRTRSCSNPRAAFGGRSCEGADVEERGCVSNPRCHPLPSSFEADPAAGFGSPAAATAHLSRWSEWGAWSPCSVSCSSGGSSGGGFQMRRRECMLPPGSRARHECSLGCSREYRQCSPRQCGEVRSGHEWTPWHLVAIVSRNRSSSSSSSSPSWSSGSAATMPPASFGLKKDDLEVDGYLERRVRYQCVARLPYGTKLRLVSKNEERRCRDASDCRSALSSNRLPVAPLGAALTAAAHRRESSLSTDASGWSEWSRWEPCSASCGGGVQRRERSCITDEDDSDDDGVVAAEGHRHRSGASGGRRAAACVGQPFEERVCGLHACPWHERRDPASAALGGWSEWSAWSECDDHTGEQHRHRRCVGASSAASDPGDNAGDESADDDDDYSAVDGRRPQSHQHRYWRRCLMAAGVHVRETRTCVHENAITLLAGAAASMGRGGSTDSGPSLCAAGDVAGVGPLVMTTIAVIAYLLGIVTMAFVVRLYNRYAHDRAIIMGGYGGGALVAPSPTSRSASLQAIPVPKRLGSLPLVPVESNTYVPTSAFRVSSKSPPAAAVSGGGGGGGTGGVVAAIERHYHTLQSTHSGSPSKGTATIKRSNTFRAQIGDDHNF